MEGEELTVFLQGNTEIKVGVNCRQSIGNYIGWLFAFAKHHLIIISNVMRAGEWWRPSVGVGVGARRGGVECGKFVIVRCW